MIAPRDDDGSVTEESNLIVLPRDTVVSIQGINVTAPTSLLIRDSPYWTYRVTEHAVQSAASPSAPIVLDLDGITAYELLVYVGLLQAEDHMQRALWGANQANQNPLFEGVDSCGSFDTFATFAPAGLPAPSPRTLSNVSRMAAFFGREDLVVQVPDSIVNRPSSPPFERSQTQNGSIYARTMQHPGDNDAHIQDDANTPTYYRHSQLGNDTDPVHGQHRSSPPMPPLSATETGTETETEPTSCPDGRVVLPPILSPLSPFFYVYGSSPEQSHANILHDNFSVGETGLYDRSSPPHSQRSSRLPRRFYVERDHAAERRHHPYRRSSRRPPNTSRGTQTME